MVKKTKKSHQTEDQTYQLLPDRSDDNHQWIFTYSKDTVKIKHACSSS